MENKDSIFNSKIEAAEIAAGPRGGTVNTATSPPHPNFTPSYPKFKYHQENGFHVESRFDDRMVILTPVREDMFYAKPDYTFVFLNGLREQATNYKRMYLYPN